jgi:uridine kinase
VRLYQPGKACQDGATVMSMDSKIIPVVKRTTVQVTFPDGRTFEGPRGTPVEAFVRGAELKREPPVVAALFRGDLRELSAPVAEDGDITPLDTGTGDGSRIYRRSLVFVLVAAVRELFPDADVAVDHSVSDGGFFCTACGRPPFSPEELHRVEMCMRRITEADEQIRRREVPLDEAMSIFQREGYLDKVRLLKTRSKDYVTLYSLRGIEDYFHGYMVPSTGYLKLFHLSRTAAGFILRFPRRHVPNEILPTGDYPKLWATFREYGEWQERLGLEDVGMLNEAIEKGRGSELILVSEALHDQKTADIARRIAESRERIRLVLIAGPSSSGKTTFARRLSIQLLSQGLRPYPLEMDNYFVDRDKTPRDESGEADFEAFAALDRDRLNEDLKRLLSGEEVPLPRFDFPTGQRTAGDTVRLPKGTVIIMEGIHGLNPELLPRFEAKEAYRIYVSALTQLNLDRHNRISTTDTRLVRRIVRDATARGHSPAYTISGWDRVRRGERKNIFIYQENCDSIFNSALVYELSALRPIAEPLLQQVKPDTPEYIESKRLLAFLAWFRPLSAEFIPDDSILREFIGGSILEQFRVWGT